MGEPNRDYYTEHVPQPEDESAPRSSHCYPLDAFPEAVVGRILYEVEKIIDHTQEQSVEIPGWRMKAIREAAERIENEFVGQKTATD